MKRATSFVLLTALSACATTPPAQSPRAEHLRAPAQDKTAVIAVTHDGGLVLLTTQTSGQLTWINAHMFAAVGDVRVGNDPNWVEITPDDRYAVVSNTADDTAVVVDVRQRSVLGRSSVSAKPKRLTVGACPEAAVSPKEGRSP